MTYGKYIDVHAHLNDAKFLSDLPDVMSAVAAAGVVVINAGFDYPSSVKAAEISREYGAYFCPGVHPDDARAYDASVEAGILSLAGDEKCVAIGETGFDFYWNKSSVQEQERAFDAQINLAFDLRLPVVVHSRDACRKTYDFLSERKNLLKYGFLLHCYSESAEMAERFADLGAYFSLGGVVTFKNAKKDGVIAAIPTDRLLSETDCPYLTPEPFRGTRNDPAKIGYVVRKLAAVKGVSEDEMCAAILRNAKKLFGKLKI